MVIPKFSSKMSLVHVDDLSKGIVDLIEQGKTGESYIFGGREMTLKEMVIGIAGAFEKKVFILELPGFLLMPFFKVYDLLCRLVGHHSQYNSEMFRFMKGDLLADDRKMRNTIDFKETNFDEGFRKMVLGLD